ncbi:YggS family pyridoxal phosphate-dependent enzyme [Puia dinghuensis]|uniref:Pyridoxal phosphate homeostasis protein n=1 Tax=Puia dinghuensis TaxID=1792502 RepID=A0A8J2XPJ0_9BACT|nr:YggS family pyridoxal phosphate-dependent enzyme [Puia dinghuensis]GGA88243.1 YggS family pyridoxal phosphate enzyme [Puia dinghuensis]
MSINREAYWEIRKELGVEITLVAVSKTKPVSTILALYSEGQRDFGENYVQELTEKQQQLPADVRWHFIGHLQSNKVKYIISFVYLIHGVDSLRLLKEIDRQAAKAGRVVDVLLQVHIAREETKYGFDAGELEQVMETVRGAADEWAHVRIRGLMGMASNTDDVSAVSAEFRGLKVLLDRWFPADGILSMGMSGDYQLAVKEGSTMVRIGSLLFGSRG